MSLLNLFKLFCAISLLTLTTRLFASEPTTRAQPFCHKNLVNELYSLGEQNVPQSLTLARANEQKEVWLRLEGSLPKNVDLYIEAKGSLSLFLAHQLIAHKESNEPFLVLSEERLAKYLKMNGNEDRQGNEKAHVWLRLLTTESQLQLKSVCLATWKTKTHQEVIAKSENEYRMAFLPLQSVSTEAFLVASLLLLSMLVLLLRSNAEKSRMLTISNLVQTEQQGFSNRLAVTFELRDFFYFVLGFFGIAFFFATLSTLSDYLQKSFITLPFQDFAYFSKLLLYLLVSFLVVAGKLFVLLLTSYALRMTSYVKRHLLLFSRLVLFVSLGLLLALICFTLTHHLLSEAFVFYVSVGASLAYAIFLVKLYLELKNTLRSKTLYIISYLCIIELMYLFVVIRILAPYTST